MYENMSLELNYGKKGQLKFRIVSLCVCLLRIALMANEYSCNITKRNDFYDSKRLASIHVLSRNMFPGRSMIE